MIARSDVERDVVIVACAISAGIHAALAPDHFAEGTGAGVGFVVAAVGLAAVPVALTLRPASVRALTAAGALFLGLIASYALAVTTGVPVLHAERETFDALALATKAVELVGLVAAAQILRSHAAVAPSFPTPKGTLT